MKLFIIFLTIATIACLAVTDVYGLDAGTKSRMTYLYNLSANLYNLIIQLIDDVADEKIAAGPAGDKLSEWEKDYAEETKTVPQDAEKMCGLMKRMIKITREIVRDYQPLNQKTKDLLKELDGTGGELKAEMGEIKYMLQ